MSPGPFDNDGWRRMFEMGADNPAAWMASAENLLRASRVVAPPVVPGVKLVDVIIAVQAMLLGMSVECALKAMWLKQGKRYERPGQGFLRNGKLELRAMKGAAKHDLRAMATEVGVSETTELELVERLSWFVLWIGRYPVPGTAEQMAPRRLQKSGRVIPIVITPQELQHADALALRLIDQAAPWK